MVNITCLSKLHVSISSVFGCFFSIIVDKIDKDNDGKITEDELKSFIDHTQKRYIYEDVDRQWNELNPEKHDSLGWQEYVNITYGYDVGKLLCKSFFVSDALYL